MRHLAKSTILCFSLMTAVGCSKSEKKGINYIKAEKASVEAEKQDAQKQDFIYEIWLKDVDETLRADKDVVMEAVMQNGLALEYASEDLKEDREIVTAAVMQNPLAWVFAEESAKNAILEDEDVRHAIEKATSYIFSSSHYDRLKYLKKEIIAEVNSLMKRYDESTDFVMNAGNNLSSYLYQKFLQDKENVMAVVNNLLKNLEQQRSIKASKASNKSTFYNLTAEGIAEKVKEPVSDVEKQNSIFYNLTAEGIAEKVKEPVSDVEKQNSIKKIAYKLLNDLYQKFTEDKDVQMSVVKNNEMILQFTDDRLEEENLSIMEASERNLCIDEENP